jgi:hypothetical protein
MQVWWQQVRRWVLGATCASSVVGVVSLGAGAALAVETDGKWHHEFNEDGVSVSMMTEEGRTIPAFRGVTTVDGSLFEVLGMLDDAKRATDWMANCMENKVLKQVNEFDRIIYNRTDAPWPVSDRDVVIFVGVTADIEKREVSIKFNNISNAGPGPIDGVVRMPRLRGHYKLQYVDEKHTKVTYQIDADSGGSLPEWLIIRASRELPVKTLTGLRKQLKKTMGNYDDFVKRYDPSRGGKIPEQFTKGSGAPGVAPAQAQP